MLSNTVALRSGLDFLQTVGIEPLSSLDADRHWHISFVLPDFCKLLATDSLGFDVLILVLDLVVINETRSHHLLTE